jgi:hypothetical protein
MRHLESHANYKLLMRSVVSQIPTLLAIRLKS